MQRHGDPLLQAGVSHHQPKGAADLEQRQGRRHRQVEQIDRLAVDFHLQRGVAGTAQDQDHPKAGEIEQEDQQRGGCQRRAQQRQSHFPESPPGRSAQHPRRRLQLGVQVGPEAAHHPQDDGVIVEHVGQQDDAQTVHQVDGRAVEAQDSHGNLVGPAFGSQQRGESRRHHDGRQDEGDSRQRLQQRLAPELVAGENVGRWQGGQQRQQGRKSRLPGGEPQRPSVVRRADQSPQRGQRWPSLRSQAQPEYGEERVEIEQPQKSQGDQVQGNTEKRRRGDAKNSPCFPASVFPCSCVFRRHQCNTVSVQASIHFSRFWSMASGLT